MSFFFNDTATTEIYTLSLHDALPILALALSAQCRTSASRVIGDTGLPNSSRPDRKSTRLNSSHTVISYAVFCLKKKKKPQHHRANRQQKSYAAESTMDKHL